MLFGLGLAVWSANAGLKAIIDALNVIYDEPEKRGFIMLNLVSLTFTVGGCVMPGRVGVMSYFRWLLSMSVSAA